MLQSWRQACLKEFIRHQKRIPQTCVAQFSRRPFATTVVCYAAPRSVGSKQPVVLMEEFPCEVIRCATSRSQLVLYALDVPTLLSEIFPLLHT